MARIIHIPLSGSYRSGQTKARREAQALVRLWVPAEIGHPRAN
jgi:hypothetical protein